MLPRSHRLHNAPGRPCPDGAPAPPRPAGRPGPSPCAAAARQRNTDWKAQLAERYPELAAQQQSREERGGDRGKELLSLDSGWSVEATDLAALPPPGEQEDQDQDLEGLSDIGSDLDSGSDEGEGEDSAERRAAARALQTFQGDSTAAQQAEADRRNELVTPRSLQEAKAARKTHARLRIVCGDFARRKLLSGQGRNTRPMMELVRCAVFDMLGAVLGTGSSLPADTSWLDLYAGTGAVGLEGLSRGAREATFVEMDAWTVTNVLQRNLQRCGVGEAGRVVATRAEAFLQRAQQAQQEGRAAPAPPFDFISVCPPYEAVSYPEVFGLLGASPLLKAGTLVVVEYPQANAREVPQHLGGLTQLRNRRFGRTYVAIYGPPPAGDAAAEGAAPRKGKRRRGVVLL